MRTDFAVKQISETMKISEAEAKKLLRASDTGGKWGELLKEVLEAAGDAIPVLRAELFGEPHYDYDRYPLPVAIRNLSADGREFEEWQAKLDAAYRIIDEDEGCGR